MHGPLRLHLTKVGCGPRVRLIGQEKNVIFGK